MGPLGRRGRRRGLIVGAAVGSSMARNSANRQAESAQAEAVQPQAAAPAATEDKFAQLEKLAQLKAEGILTDEEFQAQKTIILNQ